MRRYLEEHPGHLALMRDSRSCRRIQQSMGIRSGQRSGVSLIVAAFVGNLTDKTQATGV
jgi:hypothetical protein